MEARFPLRDDPVLLLPALSAFYREPATRKYDLPSLPLRPARVEVDALLLLFFVVSRVAGLVLLAL